MVHQKLQQRLATSDRLVTQSTEHHHRDGKTRTTDSHLEKEPSHKTQDLGDLTSSESNSITSDANHQIGMAEDGRHCDDAGQDEQYQDRRFHPGDDRTSPSGIQKQLHRERNLGDDDGQISPASQMSENWEDSVQFVDVAGQQRRHYQDVAHDDKEEYDNKDEDDGGDEDSIVIPKALNDVSSANFLNVLGMDGGSVALGAHGGNYQYEDTDAVLQRLQGVHDRLSSGEMMHGVAVGHHSPVDDDHAGDILGELHGAADLDGNHGSNRTFSISEDSAESIKVHRQEQQNFREAARDARAPVLSETGGSRILADATNRQRRGVDVRQPSISHASFPVAEKDDRSQRIPTSSTGHPKTVDAWIETIPSQNLTSENLDPMADIPSRLTDESSTTRTITSGAFRPIREASTDDNDGCPRQFPEEHSQEQATSEHPRQIAQSHSELQRQRSLSWSSDDNSVVLTLDPRVADRQQKRMEERMRTTKVAAEYPFL